MSSYSNICNICMLSNNNLLPIDQNGGDNIKFVTKLSTCIPNLNWSKKYMICENCTQTLNIVYDFHNMCLHSFKLESKNDEFKYDSDTTLNNHGDDPDITDNEESKSENESYNKIKNTNDKENLNIKLSSTDIQTSLCNSLLNKKFKTNRLHDVNKELSVQQENKIKSNNLNEIKCEYILELICYHCDKKFCDKETLATHLNTEHICTDISKSYKQVESDDNLKNTRKKRQFKCSNCFCNYTTEKVLKSHILKCTSILKPKVNDQKNIKTELHEDNRVFTNENTQDKAINIKRRIKRGRKALEKQIYQCNTCSVIFSTKYLLSRHIRNVHATEKLYKCDICIQKFASPVYLSAHKRYHSGERPHICSTCGKGFITTSDLYHHEKIHANKRAYKCSKCPKAFNTSSDLHKHNICVHLDRSEWKYVCTFCNKRFPLKSNMDTHVKIHTGEKNFSCHMCDRKFINRSVLSRHIDTHTNVRSFRCNVCNQEYKYQKSLDIHMTKAHGIGNAKIPERIKKYFCHICPKSFYANSKLQKHIRIHTGERPFICNICGKKFIDRPALNHHMKTIHSILFGILNN